MDRVARVLHRLWTTTVVACALVCLAGETAQAQQMGELQDYLNQGSSPARRPAPLDDAAYRNGGFGTPAGGGGNPFNPFETSRSTPAQRGDIQPVEFSADDVLHDPLHDVAIEGNKTIPAAAITRLVETRPGRPPSPRQIQDDVTRLLNTRWFLSVRPIYRSTEGGPVLVFQVTERPIIRSVQFVGNKKLKTEELQANIGLRTGHGYDVSANRESVQRILSLYREKGFRFATVELRKGSSPDDRDVIFAIEEGPKVKVWSIQFDGNSFVSKPILKTKLSTKTVMLWMIGGNYDPDLIQSDVLTLRKYYTNLGFFDVQVEAEETFSQDNGHVTVTFRIDEGMRYRVGEIQANGNDVLSSQQLMQSLELSEGEFFNARFLREDVSNMKDKYDELGRLFASVEPVPHFREDDPGWVDLVYQIDEDIPRLVGTININIRGDYPHTQERVIRNQVTQYIKPGQLANGKLIQLARARVSNSPLWDRAEPVAFDIRPVAGAEYFTPQEARGQDLDSDLFRAALTETSVVEPLPRPTGFGHSLSPIGQLTPQAAPITQPIYQQSHMPTRADRGDGVRGEHSLHSEAARMPRPPVDPLDADRRTSYLISPDAIFAEPENSDFVYRGQSPMPAYRGQSMNGNGTPIPQDYLQGVSPQGDPYGDALRAPAAPGFVDVNIDVTEGRTGRLMFGVGVNSDAGVVGSIVLQEDNFNILRPPRSWADIINGQAWRGAGQSFRVEAVPGNQVSRYLVSWQDPYFMNTDFSLGLSGFYYNRFYTDWTEDRLGGRISVGKTLNAYWSANAALRLENVDVHGIRSVATAPTSLTSVQGGNFLSTAAGTLSYDTRDSAFLPSEGHFVEATYEQGFGEFVYPRVEAQAGQFFTVYERPDGYGKHILQFRGQLGWTGNDTPVFERFYAGGYSSFRGFSFRGVSPQEGAGYITGGTWMALGTAEYMVPITASDSVRAVVFTDFGTVDSNVSLSDFRLTAGFGFRLTIPAMGPAPLAFDFAWPILDEKIDTRRVFSFYIGFTR
ncbi:MAG: outer membrane protein assembly factor [Planctomycetaceae bacterium]|nr:outer membrane protein assembly factor [Planctomycetaceae bacterium]